MKHLHSFALVALIFAVGFLALMRPATSDAQTTSQGVAMAAGPLGVWIVRGDRVVICQPPQIQNQAIGQPPPAPVCSTPTRLP